MCIRDSPNFYYRTSTVQLLFLAPLAKLAALLPPPLEPLHALPRHGLVALTYFSYHVCDNDPYNEVSIAVILRRPGARQPGRVANVVEIAEQRAPGM